MSNTTQHIFEKAGLGTAPFRVLGIKAPVVMHFAMMDDVVHSGGTCEYCGTAIATCWEIMSTDGRRSIIGSDCILKTGDKGLKKVVAKARAQASKAREVSRIAQLVKDLEGDALRDLLASKVHPVTYRAAQGETLLDSVEWFLAHAGHAGKLKTVRLVAKIVKHVE